MEKDELIKKIEEKIKEYEEELKELYKKGLSRKDKDFSILEILIYHYRNFLYELKMIR